MAVRIKKFNTNTIQDELSKRPQPAGQIRRLKESTEVQFLQNPEDWVAFESAWLDAEKRSVVATDDNIDDLREKLSAEGKYLRTSYIANVLDIKKGNVFILEMGKALAARVHKLSTRQEDGDITNVIMELEKEGTGLDTKYDAFYGGAVGHRNDLTIHDLEQALEQRIERDAQQQAGAEADLDEDSDSQPITKRLRKG